MKKRLIVITDCAYLLPLHDPDDALALFYLLTHPDIEIQAIVTTFGNTSESQAFRCVTTIMENLHKDVRILHGPKNRHEKTEASNTVKTVYEILNKNPGKILMLSLGPLTFINQLLNYENNSKRLWRDLVIIGGLGKSKHLLYPLVKEEFNLRSDPYSFNNVVNNSKPIMVTVEDCDKEIFGLEDIRQIPSWLKPSLYLWYFLNLCIGKKGFSPYDLTAIKVLVKP